MSSPSLPQLELILGCMYSGKSSTLLKKLGEWKSMGKQCAVINHTNDTRCGEEVRTHSGSTYQAYKYHSLATFKSWQDYDVILVDEGQFFPDIVGCVQTYLTAGKTVIVAGLSGDSKQKPFENICGLLSLADRVVYTRALCSICRDGTPASFSRRLVKSKARLLPGGADVYMAVCRKHLDD